MRDFCLEPGKIEAPKCVDLVSKSAINSDKLRVQLQASSQASHITDTKHLSQHPDNI
jgi:hypothetical protein